MDPAALGLGHCRAVEQFEELLRPAPVLRMKSALLGPLKTMLGSALYATAWRRQCFRDKYLVSAPHRMNDARIVDGVSCTLERFGEICNGLAEYFGVVPQDARVAAIKGRMPFSERYDFAPEFGPEVLRAPISREPA